MSLTRSFTYTRHDNLYMNGNISVIMEVKPFTEPKEIKKDIPQVKKCLCNPEIGRHPKCPTHSLQ